MTLLLQDMDVKVFLHLVSASRDRFIARPTTQHSVCGTLQKLQQEKVAQILL